MYWLKAGFLLLLLFTSFCFCAIKSTSNVNAFQRCVDEAIQQFPASSSLQSHQLIFKIRTFLNNFQQNISYLKALSEAKRTKLLDEICAVCIAYMRLEPSVDIAAPDGSDKQTVTDLYRQKVAGLVAVSITEAMDLFCSDNTMSLLIIAQLVCIQGLESNSVLETFLETITRNFFGRSGLISRNTKDIGCQTRPAFHNHIHISKLIGLAFRLPSLIYNANGNIYGPAFRSFWLAMLFR